MTTKERGTFYGQVQELKQAFVEVTKPFYQMAKWVLDLISSIRKTPESAADNVTFTTTKAISTIGIVVDWDAKKQRVISAATTEIVSRKRAKQIAYRKNRSQQKNMKKWARKRG